MKKCLVVIAMVLLLLLWVKTADRSKYPVGRDTILSFGEKRNFQICKISPLPSNGSPYENILVIMLNGQEVAADVCEYGIEDNTVYIKTKQKLIACYLNSLTYETVKDTPPEIKMIPITADNYWRIFASKSKLK